MMAFFIGSLLFSLAMYRLPGLAKGELKFVEPFPENIYPVEFTSAKVTCVAFDSSEIKFFRRDWYAQYTELTPDENIYFTTRIEENGRKRFVTMHIRNVTMEYDSVNGELGRYECHAYAVGQNTAKFGFSVSVISTSEFPTISLSPNYDEQVLPRKTNVTLRCTIHNGSGFRNKLKRVSWLKDGKRMKNICPVRYPDPNDPDGNLDPLELENISGKDSGTYTCLLEAQLRHIMPYNVTAETTITVM